jgi:hypothetical protein
VVEVVQLREQLKTRGLGTAGNKTVLIQRLTESFNSEEKILQSESAAFDDDQGIHCAKLFVCVYEIGLN